jgi:hypothetical protein
MHSVLFLFYIRHLVATRLACWPESSRTIGNALLAMVLHWLFHPGASAACDITRFPMQGDPT